MCVLICAGIETVGKNVVVAGRSKNVGLPIAMLLHTDQNHERPGGKSVYVLVCDCACMLACSGMHHYITTFHYAPNNMQYPSRHRDLLVSILSVSVWVLHIDRIILKQWYYLT